MQMNERALSELARTIRLVIFDFDGVFTDNTVYVCEDGTESVRCWRGDGLGLRKLDRLGITNLIVSTESNPVVSARARKLAVRCVQDVQDKRATVEALAREHGVALTEVAYLGNDINDLEALAMVGFPVAVHDAHPDILDRVRYRTLAPGGRGAVRELCDLLDRAHDRHL
jgi:YrbI family 3-deoxy-D-manno-octulosonate 8-phosphate phosphatase